MKIRRPFRAVLYAAVIAAAVGYVVFSAAQQPAWLDGTSVGTVVAKLQGKARPTGQSPWYMFADPTGGWHHVDISALSEADMTDPKRSIVKLDIRLGASRWGIWHPLSVTRRDEIRFSYLATRAAIADSATRLSVLEGLRTSGAPVPYPDDLDHYASGGSVTTRILWLGVLGDLSILAAFTAIIFSLVKLRGEIRWRKPGHCTECDYNLAGLTTNKCPECGAAVISASWNEGA